MIAVGFDFAGMKRAFETPDSRHGIEHVIAYYQNGKITRQIDVEAWD